MYTMIKNLIVYPYIGGWSSTHFHTDMYVYIYIYIYTNPLSLMDSHEKGITRNRPGSPVVRSLLHGSMGGSPRRELPGATSGVGMLFFFPCP